ncbi:MAG: alanine racemase [Ignavibacteriales bacterium]|nr:alanine racemase [Ignavibacteriales bacterium]
MAEVNLSAIAFNLKGVRKKVGDRVQIMAVVKANAYGHGLEGVSTFVEKGLVDCFGVAFPEEGQALRMSGIRKPIHVFTLPTEQQARLYIDHNLESTISSVRDVAVLQRAAEKSGKTLPVHLKIDTGMNRLGIKPEDVDSVVSALRKARRVEVKGVFTHFATADEPRREFVMYQLEEFRKSIEHLRALGVVPEVIHCANSASILDLPETYFSLVRPGVMMYGYYPSRTTSESVPLKIAMTLKTRVALVKWIRPGESVSYGRKFVATRRTRIATLPIGYADGYTRLLTGKASVLVHGKKFPVVGSICMDQIMVDVGEEAVEVGEEAILIGSQSGETISAWDLAGPLGTIPYETCCAISSRVPRMHIS